MNYSNKVLKIGRRVPYSGYSFLRIGEHMDKFDKIKKKIQLSIGVFEVDEYFNEHKKEHNILAKIVELLD